MTLAVMLRGSMSAAQRLRTEDRGRRHPTLFCKAEVEAEQLPWALLRITAGKVCGPIKLLVPLNEVWSFDFESSGIYYPEYAKVKLSLT